MKNLLHEYMEENRLSITKMAKMVGVSYGTFYGYYHKGEIPRIWVAKKIDEVTKGGVPLSYWGYKLCGSLYSLAPPKGITVKIIEYRTNKGDEE